MFENLTPIDVIVLCMIASTLLIIMTVIMVTMHKMKNRMDEMSRMMYILIKKNDIQVESTDDIKHALSTLNGNLKTVSNEINDNIGSLSSSTSKALLDIKKDTSLHREIGYYPTPNISKMIRETILECINIEVLLNKDIRIPNPNSVHHIIETVINTYPDVNREYVTKLCMAMIENFVEDVSSQQRSQK